MNLKNNVISGVKWTSISTIIVSFIQIIQLIILAKYLDPNAFGLMAVLLVVIGFSQTFADMGISNAIIHKQEISRDQLSTLYWINIVAGFVLFSILVALSPLIAKFYKVMELEELIFIVSLIFIIQPLGHQFSTLWQKNMRFKEIALIDILSKSCSLISSVYLAYLGCGVYSLVYGTLIGVITQTFLYLYMGLKEYRPEMVFKIKDIHEFLNFGLFQMGEKTVNYFNIQIDIILIGKLLGTEALGIYFVAKQIVIKISQLVNPVIAKVSFPAFSKIQNDSFELKNAYLKSLNLLMMITLPLYAFIFIFANELVKILFGDKYLDSIYILQILAVWGAAKSTGSIAPYFLFALGKANWSFWWNLVLLFFVSLCLFIGSNWGMVGISWAFTLSQLILITPTWFYLIKPLSNIKFWEYHKHIFVAFFIAFFASIVSYLSIFHISTIFIKFFIGSIVGLVMAIVLNYIFNKKMLEELKNLKK